jgi:hypothetical protein
LPQFSSSQDVLDESRPWQWRVMRASLGTTAGLIVMAMLAKQPKHGPALGANCEILTDGRVVAKVRRYGVWGRAETIGTAESVRDSLRRLADHCKLSDADREALFEELRRWIFKDHRAKSEA